MSRVHANFIINRGERDERATCSSSCAACGRGVRQAKGVELEPEVLLYGKEWKDVL